MRWGHRIPIWSKYGVSQTDTNELSDKIEKLAERHPKQMSHRIDGDGDDTLAVFVCVRDEDETGRIRRAVAGL